MEDKHRSRGRGPPRMICDQHELPRGLEPHPAQDSCHGNLTAVVPKSYLPPAGS